MADVSIRTVETWSKMGILSPIKIGGIVRFRREDVEDALAAFRCKRHSKHRADFVDGAIGAAGEV